MGERESRWSAWSRVAGARRWPAAAPRATRTNRGPQAPTRVSVTITPEGGHRAAGADRLRPGTQPADPAEPEPRAAADPTHRAARRSSSSTANQTRTDSHLEIRGPRTPARPRSPPTAPAASRPTCRPAPTSSPPPASPAPVPASSSSAPTAPPPRTTSCCLKAGCGRNPHLPAAGGPDPARAPGSTWVRFEFSRRRAGADRPRRRRRCPGTPSVCRCRKRDREVLVWRRPAAEHLRSGCALCCEFRFNCRFNVVGIALAVVVDARRNRRLRQQVVCAERGPFRVFGGTFENVNFYFLTSRAVDRRGDFACARGVACRPRPGEAECVIAAVRL